MRTRTIIQTTKLINILLMKLVIIKEMIAQLIVSKTINIALPCLNILIIQRLKKTIPPIAIDVVKNVARIAIRIISPNKIFAKYL